MMAGDRWLARALRAVGESADALGESRLSVLIFHRVLAEPDPWLQGEMDAQRFDRLLSLIASAFKVLSLGDAVALQDAGQLPARALTITFDDGYADNAQVALPLLRRHGLPATFFVATGFLDGGRMWNDTVIETLRRCSQPHIDLSPWGAGVMPLGTPALGRAAFERVLAKVKYFSLQERDLALAQLHVAAGRPVLPDTLMMTSDEVRSLHQAGMELGGHTVRHPILSVLPDEEAEQEIRDGRSALQAMSGSPVEVFAYPNGGPGRDYDQRHVAMVKRLGFKTAVSTAPGVAMAGTDRFQVPRFTPWDPSPWRWAGRLMHQRAFGTSPLLA